MKVKCSYCGSIYEEGINVCEGCGASAFEPYLTEAEKLEAQKAEAERSETETEETETEEEAEEGFDMSKTVAAAAAGISMLGRLFGGNKAKRSVQPPRSAYRTYGNPAGGHGGWERMPMREPGSSMHRGPQAGSGRGPHGRTMERNGMHRNSLERNGMHRNGLLTNGMHGSGMGGRHSGGRKPMGRPGGKYL